MKKKSPTLALQGLFSFVTGTRRLCARAAMTASAGLNGSSVQTREVNSMPSSFNRFEGLSMFDDKGEVKRLVERLLQDRDPDVAIEGLRKMDFSYIFTLRKRGRIRECELLRNEIDDSWGWRNGNIDESLQGKVEKIVTDF